MYRYKHQPLNFEKLFPLLNVDQPSISSMFYARIFHMKFWRQKISNPKHSFVIFGIKILYKKCVRKKLMKLTPRVTHFVPSTSI
jgi:hypothetical protein